MARILITDDNEQNRYLLEALFSGNGYEVLSATNGQEALTLARSSPLDLVITDILMPVMDGFSLCRELKSDPELGRVPLIFYSATYTDQKDIELGLSLGADLFLIKPADPDKLLSAAREVMAKKADAPEPVSPPAPDSVYLKEYNQALIRKLEKKMLQLEAEIETRRKTEIQLLRFKTAIENADESIILIDPEGLVEYVNSAFEKTTGVSKQEVVGHPPDFLKAGDRRSGISGEQWEGIRKGNVWRGHLTKSTDDGNILEMDVVVSPITGQEHQKSGYVAIMRDITHQMVMEARFAQSQKMEAIGTLAGGIAHDFNNILGIVFGNTELALDQISKGQDPEERIRRILTAATRGGKLVKQILNFSRRSDKEIKPLSLQQTVQETLNLLRSSLPATIEIRQDISGQEDIIRADPTQLQQVVMNLCTNANHAMREKGGVLSLDLKTVDLTGEREHAYLDLAPGKYQRLTVADTGHGIEKEIMDRIFDPFFTTKDVGEGTGLGLSVAHGIIKAHGGAIIVESEVGHGTSFRIYLPLSTVRDRLEDEAQSPAPAGGVESILLVDDEVALLEVYKEILARQGYEVVGVSSSLEALELFQSRPERFDLVITDHIMPHLTGLELARRLLRIEPDLAIILCCGFGSNQLVEETAAIGIRMVLSKPIKRADLSKAVREVLDLGPPSGIPG